MPTLDLIIQIAIVFIVLLVVARTIRSIKATEKKVNENNKMLRALLKKQGVTEEVVRVLLKNEE